MHKNPNFKKSQRKQATPQNEVPYIKENPWSIQHMPQTPENIRAALSTNGRTIKFVETRTEEWIKLATDTTPDAILEIENPSRELIKKCVGLAPYLVLLDDLRFRDEELLDIAVTVCPELCEKDEVKVLLTYDMIMHAIEKNPAAIQYVDELFLRDTHIEAALKKDGNVLRYVPHQTPAIAKLAIENGSAEFVKCWDPDMAMLAVKKDPLFLQYVPQPLRTQEVVMEAVTGNGLALEFVASDVCDYIQIDELDEFLKNAYDGDRADLELANNIKQMNDNLSKFDKIVGRIDKTDGTDTNVISELANIM